MMEGNSGYTASQSAPRENAMKKKSRMIILSTVVVLAVALVVAYSVGALDPLIDYADMALHIEPSGAANSGANAYSQPALTAPHPTGTPQVNAGFPFADTSMLKPPAGSKVAILEWEDLECPACAHAFPLVRAAVDHYHIPLVRHDFPLTEIHIWSFDAAVTARYIQDSISPRLADSFRGDVFANQTRINSKDDLDHFTRTWFQSHGQAMPFVIDPSGACRNEVKSDRALGDRLGIHSTPCILVVTQNSFVPVVDMAQLNQVIDEAIASSKTASVDSQPVPDIQPAPAQLTAALLLNPPHRA
jgi:protein-disulfide isomerase